MRRTGVFAWGVAAVAAIVLSACGGASVEPPVTGGPEVKTAGALSLDEAGISAAIDSGTLKVAVVLGNASKAQIAGALQVWIVDLGDQKAVRKGESTFVAGEGESTVEVPLETFDGAADQARQAAYVIRYLVRTADGVMSGYRSLFVAVPKSQVVLLSPKTYYAGAPTRVKVLASDPVTGRPFADRDVTITAKAGEAARDFQVKTDSFGAVDALLDFADAGQATVTAKLTTPGGGTDQAQQAVDVVRLRRVLVSTDKPMYQPGQTMHLRVLALKKPSLSPEAGADFTLEVLDGKGNKVFKHKGKTSTWGIASAQFKLASEVNVGTYKIKATVADTATEKAVTVDRYTLPKFKVETAMDRPFYTVGQTVAGTVTARYFFGKAVAGADVRVSLATFDVEFTDFATVTGNTDAEGLFHFEAQLPPYLVGQSLEQGKAIVRLTSEVKDTAGQVVKKEIGLAVSQDAFDVIVIPESGEIVKGVGNQFYVFAEDPAGNPVAAAVHVLAGLQTFEVATDATGIGSFGLVPTGDAVTVNATATDTSGTQVVRTFTFQAGASGESLMVRPDRAIYKVGETAKVDVFAPDARDRVYLDVIRHYQVAREEALDLVDGHATVEIDLDAEMSGDVVFSAFYLGRTGQIVRDERLTFVQGADSLDVTVTPDKATYKPGEPAKVAFHVAGPDGTPVAAALGVQVVDEAVYALSGNQPGLLRTYFELEDEIATPRYEIHGAHFDLSGIVTEQPADPSAQEDQEKKASAAFAAIGNPSLTGTASSWVQALKATIDLLNPFYLADKQRVVSAVMAKVNSGELNQGTVIEFLTKPKPGAEFNDFFGNPYAFASSDSWNVTMASRGPDELAGTADDWQVATNVYEFMGWGWGPGEGDFNGAPQAGAGDPTKTQDAPSSGSGAEPKIRKDFPETLYVNPALITDGNGDAVAELAMADSITEWRLSALANSLTGRLGSVTKGLTVFLDFFVDVDVPRTMTRGDEVHFPVAVYNYLSKAQTVDLQIEAGGWADLLGSATGTVTLQPGEVRGVHIGLRAKAVGWHGVTVKAYGSEGASDAVQRLIEVTPDGVEVRGAESGKLAGTIAKTVTFPATAIEGTPKVTVKVYPGVMAQAVEGLDSLLQMPSGCFEQTTATLWPDTLVLDYMMTTGNVNPEIELKAREYVNLGYQRLLTFECTGGGFTWFGDPNPANVILSAMGVMEFTDMARVQDIDEAIVPRTVDWLASKQHDDGSWTETQGSEFATVQYDDLMTTCFVTWALAEAEAAGPAGKGFGWIKGHLKDSSSTYALAMCSNALATFAPSDPATTKALADLVSRAKEDGDKAYWEAGVTGNQMYYGEGTGPGGSSIEATSLAVLALLQAGQSPDLVSRALAWLVSNKDSFGNWGTTHATILSLKAFVRSLTALTQEASGTVTVAINGASLPPLAVTTDNQDVFYTFELADKVVPAGANEVSVGYEGTGTLMYQIVWSHFEPGAAVAPGEGPLEITVAYDKTTLAVDDTVGVTATVKNVSAAPAPMVLIDLGVPPGFDMILDDLDKMVADHLIQKYETTAKQITVYVDLILPGEELVVTYKLRAKYPLKVQSPDSSASLYYDPASKSTAEGEGIEVK
jgi:hypothetical protein